MQSGTSPPPKPSFLRNKRTLALTISIVAVVSVGGVFAYNYYQKAGTYPFGPNVLEYDPNGQVWYASAWEVALQKGMTIQLDVTMKSGVGPLNMQFYDINATHIYINNEHISASKSWTLNIETDGRHQLHIDNLDPNHQIVYVTIKVTQK